jgi:hypothetical protein
MALLTSSSETSATSVTKTLVEVLRVIDWQPASRCFCKDTVTPGAKVADAFASILSRTLKLIALYKYTTSQVLFGHAIGNEITGSPRKTSGIKKETNKGKIKTDYRKDVSKGFN